MTSGAGGPTCSSASLDRSEDLGGTASRVQRWLLLERPGSWGRDALAESGLDPRVAGGLAAAARRHGVRVVLLRGAGRRRDSLPCRAFLAHTGPSRRWIEQLVVDDPARLLDIDLSMLARAERPGIGDPGPAALHLVCTNGRHDRCCADLGRPVVRALERAGTPEVWECSHIGGDRFAANLVCLPAGVYFGRVSEDRAAAIVADLAAGRLDLDHYRGRSCYPPMVQAAEIFVRRRLGERRLDALWPVHAASRGSDAVTVVLATPDGRRLEATVERSPAGPARLTCAAAQPAVPWTYHLTGLAEE